MTTVEGTEVQEPSEGIETALDVAYRIRRHGFTGSILARLSGSGKRGDERDESGPARVGLATEFSTVRAPSIEAPCARSISRPF